MARTEARLDSAILRPARMVAVAAGVLVAAIVAFLSTMHTAAGAGPPLAAGIVPRHLYVEPAAGVKPVVRAIDRAQRTVFLEMYYLSDRRVARALERAEAQGVDVRVVLERHPLGLGVGAQHMADELAAAGIGVRWGNPRFRFTHSKFLVLDDRDLIVSTANFSRSAFSANREFLVEDTDQDDVRLASAVFRSDWDGLPITWTDGNVLLAPIDARGKEAALVAEAGREIDVYGEELQDRRMEADLAAAARHRVRVRVLLPATARQQDVPRLERWGVNVRTLASPYVHAKTIVVDDREAFVGSENMSATSLDSNRELGVLVRGHAVSQLVSTFERDWQRGRGAR